MELLDIVDANDTVVDKRAMDDIYADGGPEALQLKGQTIRSIYLILRNQAGQLAIPRRAYHKKKFPGGLDFTACGHVSSGESYEEAFFRETIEEWSINPGDYPIKVLGKLSPFEYPVLHSMSMGYEIILDELPALNPSEWHELLWLSPAELLDRLPTEPNSKGDLGWIVRHFYHKPTSTEVINAFHVRN
ncbi:MAG: NUDIX domain-containing protein [Patescibacteria group bacterium]